VRLTYAGDAGTSSGGGGEPAPGGDLDHGAYSSALSTRQLGRLLLSARSMGSTQEFLRRHAAVLPEGAVVVADRQTSGKGAAPAAVIGGGLGARGWGEGREGAPMARGPR
jgi:hypothetical protein